MKEKDENRLIKRLRRAMEIYIARSTGPTDWMHYSYNGCNQKLSAWPQARTPERLRELERALRQHLPARCVYLGCTTVLDQEERKIADIIHILQAHRTEEEEK